MIETPTYPITISFSPLPSSEQATIVISGMPTGKTNSIQVVDILGKTAIEIFNGLSESVQQSYSISTRFLSSGEYSVILQLEGRNYSKHFIINH